MIGMTGSAVGSTRVVLVGCVRGLANEIFVPLHITHPFFVLYHGLAGAPDAVAASENSSVHLVGKVRPYRGVTQFVVTPATFLSGSFYPSPGLPPLWQDTALEPFFYHESTLFARASSAKPTRRS